MAETSLFEIEPRTLLPMAYHNFGYSSLLSMSVIDLSKPSVPGARSALGASNLLLPRIKTTTPGASNEPPWIVAHHYNFIDS
jgi:hypothetical protein